MGLISSLLFPLVAGPDDKLQVIVTRLPAQGFLCRIAVRDQGWRVAGATLRLSNSYWATVHLFHSLNHCAHAVTVAVAAVQDKAVATGFQVAQRQDMRGGQVADVDVVPDAGAVGGWIVGAEDMQLFTFPQGYLTG